jgi:predicted amidohydrolase
VKVSVYQFTSLLDFKVNLEKVKIAAEEAKAKGTEILCLSECFYSMSDGKSSTPYLVEEQNQHYLNIQSVAKDFELYLIGGTAASKSKDGRIVNRAYNFSPKGEDLGHYDKIHLFSCDLKGKKKVDEADIYESGHELNTVTVGGLKFGLNICFDLRFSEMAFQHRKDGCNVLLYPSAFTVPTGRAHWHALLRARAIENQSYVIAPGQWGQHHENVRTYGHSLIVDPWGEILADAGEGEGLITAYLDLDLIQDVRSRVPMHRD